MQCQSFFFPFFVCFPIANEKGGRREEKAVSRRKLLDFIRKFQRVTLAELIGRKERAATQPWAAAASKAAAVTNVVGAVNDA